MKKRHNQPYFKYFCYKIAGLELAISSFFDQIQTAFDCWFESRFFSRIRLCQAQRFQLPLGQ